jgi:hypothetical protein
VELVEVEGLVAVGVGFVGVGAQPALLAVLETVLVAVVEPGAPQPVGGRRRPPDHLGAVVDAVVVGVAVAGVGADGDLAAVVEAVAVGVPQHRARPEVLLPQVAEPVAVGVALVRVGAEDGDLEVVRQPVAVAVVPGGPVVEVVVRHNRQATDP